MKKRFFRLTSINVLSNLMVPLAGLIDTAFLGHLEEIRYLAGVALATVLFNYIYWTFGFLRMGITGTTAQARGRGDTQEVDLILLRYGVVALAIGISILLLQHPLREIGFWLLQADPEVLDAGRDYYNTLIWGAPATLLNFTILGWFLGREEGNKVLLLSVVDKFANVALNYLFIVRLGWASYGAGMATAMSQYLSLLVGFILVARLLNTVLLTDIYRKILNSSALTAIFTLNRDITIRTLALVSTFALFTNLSAAISTEVLVTNTLILQVITVAAYFIDGIAFATESIVGELLGQKNYADIRRLLQLGRLISITIGVTIALVFCLFPQPLFSILSDRTDVIASITNYVWWLLPILTAGAVAYLLDGYFLGLTAGKILRNSTLIAAVGCFLPLAILAHAMQSSHLLWLALTSFMAARAITLSLKVKT